MSRSELQRKVDEQQKQILVYEKKLKDVIRAYKGLAAEKEALQSTVAVLTASADAAEDDDGDRESTTKDSAEDKTADEEQGENASLAGDTSTATGENLQLNRMLTLKRAIATLTQEKSRREAAFQADKKMLLAENEALREREITVRAECDARIRVLEQQASELRARLRQMDSDREREIADHGAVLAEMQMRYGKERANCEQMERQIAELYRKVQDADSRPAMHETQMNEMRAMITRLQGELADAERRAAITPTVASLTQQLRDAKTQHARELANERARVLACATLRDERESRADALEARIAECAIAIGEYERRRVSDAERLETVTARLAQVESENATLVEAMQHANAERACDEAALISRIRDLRDQLRYTRPGINIYDVLEMEAPTMADRERYEALRDEFERYKLKAAAVLKNRANEKDADGTRGMRAEGESPSSQTESVAHLRAVIATLHERLQTGEHDRAMLERASQEKLSTLRQSLTQMQTTHERALHDMRVQMEQKIADVECEMQKQRARTIDVLAEKDNELEVMRGQQLDVRENRRGVSPSLAASGGGQATADPPVDPPQKQRLNYRKSASPSIGDVSAPQRILSRKQSAGGGGGGLSSSSPSPVARVSSTPDLDEIDEFGAGGHPHTMTSSQSPVTAFALPSGGFAESRNVFYEQQLWKREQEIVELRHAVRTAESNMREIQQSSLTKDLQHYEMIEKLKDEIRILEGKIRLFGEGGANLEYLRNVFVQLMLCENAGGRSHIVKAIASVLKLSAGETKAIEAAMRRWDR